MRWLGLSKGLGLAVLIVAQVRLVRAETPAPEPSPVAVSRLGMAAVASSGDGMRAVDDDPVTCWVPSGPARPWLAIHLARSAQGPLLAVWSAQGFKYENPERAPLDYRWISSTDSTNGSDGHWREAATVTANGVRVRSDSLDVPGARWLRLQVDRSPAAGVALKEVTLVEPAGKGHPGCWFMLGDSITDAAFNGVPTHDLRKVVRASVPGLDPVLMDGATGGDSTKQAMGHWALAADRCPPGCFVGIAFGTNDAANALPLATYRTNLQTLLAAVRASGRVPMLARIPWYPQPRLPDYLAVVDALVRENGLPAGPDLHTWFRDHPDELKADRIHPTEEGRRSIQRLWGTAIAGAYRRALNDPGAR